MISNVFFYQKALELIEFIIAHRVHQPSLEIRSDQSQRFSPVDYPMTALSAKIAISVVCRFHDKISLQPFIFGLVIFYNVAFLHDPA